MYSLQQNLTTGTQLTTGVVTHTISQRGTDLLDGHVTDFLHAVSGWTPFGNYSFVCGFGLCVWSPRQTVLAIPRADEIQVRQSHHGAQSVRFSHFTYGHFQDCEFCNDPCLCGHCFLPYLSLFSCSTTFEHTLSFFAQAL